MTSRPTRSQLRRHARRLTRDGYQPMMIINSGSDLPETAAKAIGRAIWRYRSELIPVAVATATFIAANTLHRAHHTAWPCEGHENLPRYPSWIVDGRLG